MLSTPQQNPLILPGQSLLLSGFNPDIDSATVPEDIWPQGGEVAFSDVAAVIDIVSTSALDTVAGSGARTILLVGVDANFDQITEIVSLNGLTPVATIQLFLFSNTCILQSVGALNANQGIITFSIGGNLGNVIAVGKGQSQSAAAVFPNALRAGTRAHLISAFAVIGKQPSSQATITLRRRRIGDGMVTTVALDIPITSDGGAVNIPIFTPVIFAAGEQVVVRATESSANNVLVAAVLQFSWF